ncbi:2-hydroxy-palmitic acid dioxygenase MPO1-like [Trifolium pratense]|uniref:2-hydroxy-palmitic acid dioxygenase MPO1-like n=1 Tax=Trifolium pratense TaxID=57577 RepID=UPI001E69618E|nr:2-hydroxy-palmitic acid dioxygenase MPO1-like [Trifolium pratense]
MGLLDLEKHFAFYGAYHSNPTNVAIHILFVWPLLFTALILLYFTPPIFIPSQTLLNYIHPVFVFNLGFISTVFYGLFYAALDIKAGSFVAVITFLCWVSSSFVANFLGFELAWKVVLVAQLTGWIGQFIGHGAFEKRAPALLDNLAQALLMGPFFVILEILQSTIGYEPYPGFQTKVKARIEANIKEWQDKKQKKSS